VIPGYLGSVLPGTLVPYVVSMQNAPDPGFQLYVQGVPGGDDNVGTWTQTGGQATVYQAPDVVASTTTYDLFARSVDDTARFGTSEVTVRWGFPLPVARPDLSQYSPEWSPDGLSLAFVQGGPPWELTVYDFQSSTESSPATLAWSGSAYDGRLSWSDDGARIAFSEEAGGRRAIGVVQAAGGGRSTFGPDPATSYYEGVFVPKADPGAPESLVVSQSSPGAGTVRAYPLSYAPGEAGRGFAGVPAARWPDVTRISETSGRKVLHLAAEDALLGEVVTFSDGDGTRTTLSGGGGHTHVRWAQQVSSLGPLWVGFIAAGDQTAYRVPRSGFPAPVKLYSEFFPELGMDLTFGQGNDENAISRLMPDGFARIWLVQFPPPEFTGVTRTETRELASIGIQGALAPAGWGRWLGAYQPRLGPRPWNEAVERARALQGRPAGRAARGARR